MKKGFSLIEMLVVIAIIATLIAASVGVYSSVTARAQNARCLELVSNVATALNALYQRENRWPPALVKASNDGRGGQLTKEGAACLAVHNLLSLSYTTREQDGETIYELSGLDRCGIVTPWATETLKRLPPGKSGLDARVKIGGKDVGKVSDHVLHFSIDIDGDGIVEIEQASGSTLKIRGTAAVWYKGPKGNKDDIISWTAAQEVK